MQKSFPDISIQEESYSGQPHISFVSSFMAMISISRLSACRQGDTLRACS
jgi:hypothetical protein